MSKSEEEEKQELATYVNQFLKSGHDAAKIKSLIAEYPLITAMFDGKTMRRETSGKTAQGLFLPDQSMEKKGDQILYYAGKLNPDLARNLCEDICQKFANKEHVDQNAFIKTMKLVNRLGSPEMVGVVLSDFIDKTKAKINFTDIIPQETLKQAYKHMSDKDFQFSSKPDFKADPRDAFVSRIMKN
jgi:hypothetical protein